jgi:hypothetical protein
MMVEFHTGFILREMQVRISFELATRARAKKGSSVVKQMIMGAGKSTVIGPLLGLMLADGKDLVMVICPEALLSMSRDCMTGILGSVLARRVYTFEWGRTKLPETAVLTSIRKKMERAAHDQGAVITTPSHVKTLMLQYVSALQEASTADLCLTLPRKELHEKGWANCLGTISPWFESRDRIADELATILQFWRSNCIAVIDEVDWVLHPLKSELNFPIGNSEPLQPFPERFRLPMFLLQAPLAAAAGTMPRVGVETSEGKVAMSNIKSAIEEGIASFAVQRFPHLVIMSKDWYQKQLLQPMAQWTLVWLAPILIQDPRFTVPVVGKADSEEARRAAAAAAAVDAAEKVGVQGE